jgi:uncharacterized protein YkwD
VRSFDTKLLAKVNHDRKAHHLPAYKFSPALWKIANGWAKHLAAAGALSHRPNLTTLVHNKCAAKSRAGENVAFVSGSGGSGQVGGIYQEFVFDKPHRANVRSKVFTDVGIASIQKKVHGQVQEWSVMDVANHC